MLHHEQTKLVNAKILDAEKKLMACFQCADYDHEREKILSEAVKVAREEFLERMEAASPERKG